MYTHILSLGRRRFKKGKHEDNGAVMIVMIQQTRGLSRRPQQRESSAVQCARQDEVTLL